VSTTLSWEELISLGLFVCVLYLSDLQGTQNPVRATSCRFDSDLWHLLFQEAMVSPASRFTPVQGVEIHLFSSPLDQEWIIRCPTKGLKLHQITRGERIFPGLPSLPLMGSPRFRRKFPCGAIWGMMSLSEQRWYMRETDDGD